jgi:PIN domain nuclease of toxin-antitoxin system
VRLLLDSNTFLWWRAGSVKLTERAERMIGDTDNDTAVSVVTLWEIAIKRGIGKLRFLEDFEAVMTEEAFDLLPIGYAHLRTLETLPMHHRDPFDRLLIAQALAEGIPIATGDPVFAAYGVQVIW